MDEERFKSWLRFVEFLVGTVAVGLISTVINHQIQSREVEIKEQEAVGHFLEQAVQEDVGVRRRFAQYFSSVTRSDVLRERWQEYAQVVEKEYQEALKEKSELNRKVRTEKLNAKQEEELLVKIAELEQALKPKSAGAQSQIEARIYFNIRNEQQRPGAENVASFLKENAFTVPRIELQSSGPDATEFRYYKMAEKEEAHALSALLAAGGLTAVTRYIPGHELTTEMRPRHYELWFSGKPIPKTTSP